MCDQSVKIWKNKDGYQIHENIDCGHRMMRLDDIKDPVSKLYDDSYFLEGGAGYADYIADKYQYRLRALWYPRVIKRHGLNSGKILEIGSAAGFTLEVFKEKGWDVRGIEPNPSMVKYSTETLQIPTQCSTVEEAVIDEKYDSILMLQVLEHLRNPLSVLKKLKQHIKPDGLLLVETWSYHSWLAKTLGPFWHQYSPPTVIHWFTGKALVKLLRMAGFKFETMGRPLKFISLKNGFSLLQDKYSILNTKISNRIINSVLGNIIIPYPPFDVFWAVFFPIGSSYE
jgi:2-polyprenyl-3-methyl-5-hydroxy-6-metoxy-1,4-benzoquinol methylase